MIRRLALCFVALGVIAVAGCGGPSAPVAVTTGTVTYKGEAVEGATVTMATDENELVATGMTDASGNFTMTTQFGGKTFPGAPMGKVRVTISKMTGSDVDLTNYDPDDPNAATNAMAQMFEGGGNKDPEHLLPEKYASINSSGLEETIDADPAKNVFNYVLED